MRIDFSTPIRDLKGEVIKDGNKDFTIGAVSCTALLNPYEDEKNIGADDKVRRFQIALKATAGGEQELSVEEVAELKKLIGKFFAPLVVGRAFEILDPSK